MEWKGNEGETTWMAAREGRFQLCCMLPAPGLGSHMSRAVSI